MQITLNEDEIIQAIKTYVCGQITVADGHEITVDMKAGRGPNGYTATLDILPAKAAAAAKAVSATKPFATEEKSAPAAQEVSIVGGVGGDGNDPEEEPEEQEEEIPAEKPKSIFKSAS